MTAAAPLKTPAAASFVMRYFGAALLS